MIKRQQTSGLRVDTNNTSPIVQVDDRWMEFKVVGKNIHPRSCHAAVIFENTLYVHGGYDVDAGFLGDFYRMDLEKQADGFKWIQLNSEPEQPNYPGKLKGHSAIVYERSMVIFGGQVHNDQSSNKTYIYNFDKQTWSVFEPNIAIPKLDSHAAFLLDNKMYVYGGFVDKKASYSNRLYSLDLKKMTWALEYQPAPGAKSPQPRGNFAYVVYQEEFWIFGGTNGVKTLNDFWKFNFTSKTWTQVESKDTPEPRRCHTMIVSDKYFFMFGGIQDVTKQKNDIFYYSPGSNAWVRLQHTTNLVYECSPTLKRNREVEKKRTSPPKKSTGVFDNNRISLLGTNKESAEKGNVNSGTDKTEIMKRIMEENKLKKFLERKNELLKEFNEVPTDVKRKLSPTSESMMKTLQVIGDQEYSKKPLHLEVIYDPTRTYILGKKPCARDAHSALLYKDRMLIFGGDRHLMSFSDLYYFDLKKGLESKKLYQENKD